MTKYQKAYQYLYQRIVRGELRPGRRLVLAKVAQELEMSEIPVREAVKRLEAEGLVRYDSYVGPVVAAPSNREVADTLELLAYLEGLATKLAAPHLDETHFERLEALVAEMREAVAAGDGATYQKLNGEFHAVIYERTPNQVLLRMIGSLFDHTERLWAGEPKRQLLFSDENHLTQSLRDHEQILETLRAGDAEAAEVLVRNHKRAANRRMGAWLSTWNHD